MNTLGPLRRLILAGSTNRKSRAYSKGLFHYFPQSLTRFAKPFGILVCLLLLPRWAKPCDANAPDTDQNGNGALKQLSLEQLGDVEVTTVSKDPRQVQKTPAAIFVITQEDIRRSGARSIPEALEERHEGYLHRTRRYLPWDERRKHRDRAFFPPAETAEHGEDYVSGGNLLARLQHTTGEGSDTQVQAYFDRTNRQDFELGETRDTFDVDFVQHARTGGEQELTWGLGARVSPSNFIQSSQGVNFLPAKQVDSIYSGFVQCEVPIVRYRLTLTAGTKLEHNNFSGFDYQPSVRLPWTPTEHQSFRAAVTRAVRTPSRVDQDVQFNIFDEFYTPPPTGSGPPPAPIPLYFQIQGNPKLKAEQLIGYEAATSWQCWSKRLTQCWRRSRNATRLCGKLVTGWKRRWRKEPGS